MLASPRNPKRPHDEKRSLATEERIRGCVEHSEVSFPGTIKRLSDQKKGSKRDSRANFESVTA